MHKLNVSIKEIFAENITKSINLNGYLPLPLFFPPPSLYLMGKKKKQKKQQLPYFCFDPMATPS